MAEPKVFLQVIRCTSANRTSYTPLVGEFMFETDTETLYIGNGTTVGGISISGGSGTGDITNGTNVGTAGVGLFKQKSGTILQFKKLNAGSNKVTITDDTGNDEVDINVNESNFTEVILKSVMNTKGDIIVASADDTPVILPAGTNNYNLISDSNEVSGLKWAKPENSKYPVVYKATNYTVDLFNDAVIITNQSVSGINITLPSSSGFPNDGYGKEFLILNLGTGYVDVFLASGEYFPNGLNRVRLPFTGSKIRIAGAYPNALDGWILLQNIYADIQARYDTTWDASNFSSVTAVPFNTTDIESDDYIIQHSDTNISRIIFKTSGFFKISYWLSVDSTGGTTYNVDAYLRLNGTTAINGSEISVGNYQGEDSNISMGQINYNATTNDYVELMINQNNLTGNVNNIVISIEAKV